MKWWASLLLVGMSYFLLEASPAAQKETFVPPSYVSFKVSTGRARYKAGETITLKYRVKNISNSALFAPREWEAKCPASPHLWAWFQDSSGERFVPGYAGDCSPSINSMTISERMSKEAVLLKPGESVAGTFPLDTRLFGGLRPGEYSVAAGLTGWDKEKFGDAERSELARMAAPFMTGESRDSVRIELTPNAK